MSGSRGKTRNMSRTWPLSWTNLLLALVVSLRTAAVAGSGCSCGYDVATSNSSTHRFTELLETNFLAVSDIGSYACWTPQDYSVSATGGRGQYGKFATPHNVRPNPCPLTSPQCARGVLGGDAGLQLWVNASLHDGLVPMGEILSDRADILYGSFRVRMKVTGVPGTCGAFFWFRNNSEEIDMEFLSSAYNATSRPVFLVMQTQASMAAGYNAAGTSTYDVAQLPVDPSKGFHEYRFDWTPNEASFHFDGQVLKSMYWTYPRGPGRLTLNHWSNGNAHWSKGPPKTDAVLTIAYVKSYFNSSDAARQNAFKQACKDPAAVCKVDAPTGKVTAPYANYSNPTGGFFNGHMCGEVRAATSHTTSRISTAAVPTYSFVPSEPHQAGHRPGHRQKSGALALTIFNNVLLFWVIGKLASLLEAMGRIAF